MLFQFRNVVFGAYGSTASIMFGRFGAFVILQQEKWLFTMHLYNVHPENRHEQASMHPNDRASHEENHAELQVRAARRRAGIHSRLPGPFDQVMF